MIQARPYEFTAAQYGKMRCISGPSSRDNYCYVDDPYVEKVRAKIYDNFNKLDWAKVDQLHQELIAYALEQAWAIPAPSPYVYTLWWPWAKNYHGEMSIGYANNYNYAKYIWIDKELKAKMTE